MARPRKGTEQVFYDTFADWPLEDQAAAIKVLNELHRQKSREAKRLPAPPMLEFKVPQTGLWPGEQSLTDYLIMRAGKDERGTYSFRYRIRPDRLTR